MNYDFQGIVSIATLVGTDILTNNAKESLKFWDRGLQF